MKAPATSTIPSRATPSAKPLSRKKGLGFAGLTMISGCRLFSINVKLYFHHIFHFDRTAADGNRLDSKIRLLQLGAAVVMAGDPRYLEHQLLFRAMPIQAPHPAKMPRRRMANAPRPEMDLRIFRDIARFGAEHRHLECASGLG